MKNIIDLFKTKNQLISDIQLLQCQVERLKDVKNMYERREDDIRSKDRKIEEMSSLLNQVTKKVIQLQEERINYLQNERDFEETNEKLEQLIEVYKDIIKGSKTIGTARKEADKLKEVE